MTLLTHQINHKIHVTFKFYITSMRKTILFLLLLLVSGKLACQAGEKKSDIEHPPIHVFIHVCTINHWLDVLDRQLNAIQASGLYEQCRSISLGILGEGDASSLISRYPKVSILFQTLDKTQYERPTLLHLHKVCLCDPTALVLYLHTKGVSRPKADPNISDWSRYMEYFTIECWRDCVEELKEFDVCGVNWRASPAPHFSGNFWWARADYISFLPPSIGSAYLEPEFWIGRQSPHVKCFHESDISHYNYPYPPRKYKTNPKQYIVALTPLGPLGELLQNYWSNVKNSEVKHSFVLNNPPHCKLTSFFTSKLSKNEFNQAIQNTLNEIKNGKHKKIQVLSLFQSNSKQDDDYILLKSKFIKEFIARFIKRQKLPKSILASTNHIMTLPLSRHKSLSPALFSAAHELQNDINLSVKSEWAVSIYKLNGKKLAPVTSCSIH
jgi:hypothetical protein